MHGFIKMQNRGQITAAIAVIGTRPDCNQVLVQKPVFVTFLNQLVRSADEFQAIDLVEHVDHFSAVNPAGSSGVHLPIGNIPWVRPHEVAKGAVRWDFLHAVNQTNLIQGLDVRR